MKTMQDGMAMMGRMRTCGAAEALRQIKVPRAVRLKNVRTTQRKRR